MTTPRTSRRSLTGFCWQPGRHWWGWERHRSRDRRRAPVANFEVIALRILGLTLGSGGVLPAGTVLQRVTVSTDDPATGPQGPLTNEA